MHIKTTALCFALLTTACSSIVSKSDYPVQIISEPKGADFSISNRAGTKVHTGTTPDTVLLSASAGYFKPERYTVNFSKNGYTTQNQTVNSALDPWYFGNIMLGGLVGMLGVDPATGAMYKLPNKTNAILENDTNYSVQTTAPLIPAPPTPETLPGIKKSTFTDSLVTANQVGEVAAQEALGKPRISFEGVYYDIAAGTVIGEARFGDGARRSQIEWSGQKNPNQYNELIELQLESHQYPLVKYEDRLLDFDAAQTNDLKLGLVIEEINVEARNATRHSRKFHHVKLTGKFRAYQENKNTIVYEKRFKSEAKDIPNSRKDTINAYPLAIKGLMDKLLSDPDFRNLTHLLKAS